MYKNKNVLVAGGDGLIGKQLVKLLSDRGAYVKVVDKKTNPNMDLTDYSKCLDACYDMDYVFNLLCIKGSPKAMKEKPASHLVPMLRFNTNLMEAARQMIDLLDGLKELVNYRQNHMKLNMDGMVSLL